MSNYVFLEKCGLNIIQLFLKIDLLNLKLYVMPAVFEL